MNRNNKNHSLIEYIKTNNPVDACIDATYKDKDFSCQLNYEQEIHTTVITLTDVSHVKESQRKI